MMFKNLSTEALGVSGGSSETIELALSYGFKGLDLNLPEFTEQVKIHGLPKARRLIDSARLRFGSFRLPVVWQEDADQFKRSLDAFAPTAELAKSLGCTRAITTIEPAGDMRPFHENFEFHRRKFAELGAALAPYGLRLGVEFLAPHSHKQGQAFQFIQSVDQVMQLFKSVSAPNVGLVIDTWHWHLGGGTIEQLQTVAGDRVVAVYLADCEPGVTAAHAEEKHRRLPGETGVIDCAAVLKTLAANGYDGPITPCPSPANFSGLSRDKIVKAAGAAVDAACKEAGVKLAK